MILHANDEAAGNYDIRNLDTGELIHDVVWCDTKKGVYHCLVRNDDDALVIILGEALIKQHRANITLEAK